MGIEIGTRIGSYRVTGLIGSGGMGEVYRATDERLGRDVAIKILSGVSAAESDYRERLDREARLLAAINHPHIGAIYGVDDVNGEPALVLELIEGPTLAARLREGALPQGIALALAKQIAEALEAAHDKGIIHRDLKPSNIVITPGGQAKVLDFGLAKSIGGSPNDAATKTASLTREGAVMGTAGYMSPEQARGSRVDEQADIWAFGCVLFEMITGKRAFDGSTTSDVIAAILKSEPDWKALPPHTPRNVRKVLHRCLDKDPKRRFHSIADVRLDLDDEDAAANTPSTDDRRGSLLRYAIAAAGLATIIVLTILLVSNRSRGAVAPGPSRFVIAAPGEMIEGTGIAISPNGQAIAYISAARGVRRLAVRRIDQVEARELEGTEGAAQPFFSPDGSWVAFFANRKLRKVPVSGGTSEAITDAASPRGGAWGPDNTIIFADQPDDVLLRVPAGGGTAVPATKLGDREGSHRYPSFLPGGKAIIYAAGPPGTVSGWSEAKIVAESLETGERRVVAERGSTPKFLDGRLLFVQTTQMYSVAFDPDRLQASGSPVELDHVFQVPNGSAQYDVSLNGTLLSVPSSYVPSGTLAFVDRQGAAQPLNIRVPFQTEARVSPDQTRIAYTAAAPDSAVWIYDIASRTSRQLTTGVGNLWPLWSLDSKRVAYSSLRNGSLTPFVRNADGGPEEQLTDWGMPTSWSPDGQALALFFVADGRSLWLLDRGAKQRHPAPRVSDSDAALAFSPDGRWFATQSGEGGRFEVFVYPYGRSGERIQVSQNGGGEPVWSRDGRALFYRTANGTEMMMVEVSGTGDQARFNAPRLLFKGANFAPAGNRANFDVTPDGRFLIVLLDEARPQLKLVLTQNWHPAPR